MSRGMASDFEVIEGEGILRVRKKNQAKTGKKLNFETKGKRKKKKKDYKEELKGSMEKKQEKEKKNKTG